MTENQWQSVTQQAAPGGHAAGYEPGASSGTGAQTAGSTTAGSTTAAAKEETAGVAKHAAGAAQDVAETAKAEVANVASEVKSGAMDLMHQAKSDATAQAETAQRKAAEGMRKISEELQTMAGSSEGGGVATDLVRQAADRSSSIASWLENRNPGSLLEEAKSFGRQRPGMFLLLAAGAGMLAGRLGRSLHAGAPTTATTTGVAMPPQPAQPPVMGGAVPSAGNAGYAGTPATPAPVYGETGYGESARPGADGPAPAALPLREAEDPFAADGGQQL